VNSNGFNPMRWKCDERGCFNVKKRPKIEMFCEAFPGKISLSDLDGIVEINGRFLCMEWKEEPKALPVGQRIMFDWWVAKPGRQFTVLCLAGNAETMQITHAMNFLGSHSVWKPHDFNWAFNFMKRWAAWAQKEPTLDEAAA
jgi:hypothetical protein